MYFWNTSLYKYNFKAKANKSDRKVSLHRLQIDYVNLLKPLNEYYLK